MPHRIKILLEEHVRAQLAHYELDEPFRRLSLERVRTEFFGMRRRLFESATGARAWDPYDPGPGLVLHAEKERFRSKRIPLGNFYETGASPSADKVLDQIWRTATQISRLYLRKQGIECATSAEGSKFIEDWRAKIQEGTAKAFAALRGILREMRAAEIRQ
ncbi:MAG TPA: hypothetical protein VIY49_08105 [Bryobacteraceae bacterium]